MQQNFQAFLHHYTHELCSLAAPGQGGRPPAAPASAPTVDCSFPWRRAISTRPFSSFQPPALRRVRDLAWGAGTDLLPLPAFCTSSNWKFGWPCLFIFLECSRLYFHGIFSAVQCFHFKLGQWEEKPVPVSKRWLCLIWLCRTAFINCN